MANEPDPYADVVAIPYSLERITALRKRLTDDDLVDFVGYSPTGDTFNDLTVRTAAALGVSVSVIRESISHLAGQCLTAKLLDDTAWRLAGNAPRLRRGIAVPPWTVQRAPEWVPIQVLEYTYHRTQRGAHGGLFRLRIMAGTPCPLIVTAFWPSQLCWMLARRAGYNARRDLPYSHPSEMVNMRLMALVTAEHSRGKPGFAKYGCTDQLRRWNNVVIKHRFRLEGTEEWPCPEGFDHQCYECPIGYDRCPAATHRNTFTLQRREE
jgi:hypothetical protein